MGDSKESLAQKIQGVIDMLECPDVPMEQVKARLRQIREEFKAAMDGKSIEEAKCK